jgi:hypothetical protein
MILKKGKNSPLLIFLQMVIMGNCQLLTALNPDKRIKKVEANNLNNGYLFQP